MRVFYNWPELVNPLVKKTNLLRMQITYSFFAVLLNDPLFLATPKSESATNAGIVQIFSNKRFRISLNLYCILLL